MIGNWIVKHESRSILFNPLHETDPRGVNAIDTPAPSAHAMRNICPHNRRRTIACASAALLEYKDVRSLCRKLDTDTSRLQFIPVFWNVQQKLNS